MRTAKLAYSTIMKNKTVFQKLGFAVEGIGQTWRSESSFRIQVILGVMALVALVVLRPGWLWCAVISILIGLVLAAEMMNSALEALVDRLHPEIHPEIKKVKDMASGAVLVLGLVSILVGAMMFADLI